MTSLNSTSPTAAEKDQEMTKFEFDRKRVASIFKENQPEWKFCGTLIKKKTVIENMGKFLLFCIMICYIAYQLSKYVNPNENKIEYAEVTSITETPVPYFYIDLSSYYNCTFGIYRGQDWSASFWYGRWYEWQNYRNSSLQTTFDYVDSGVNSTFIVKLSLIYILI